MASLKHVVIPKEEIKTMAVVGSRQVNAVPTREMHSKEIFTYFGATPGEPFGITGNADVFMVVQTGMHTDEFACDFGRFFHRLLRANMPRRTCATTIVFFIGVYAMSAVFVSETDESAMKRDNMGQDQKMTSQEVTTAFFKFAKQVAPRREPILSYHVYYNGSEIVGILVVPLRTKHQARNISLMQKVARITETCGEIFDVFIITM